MEDEKEIKHTRGRGRGSSFFIVGHSPWGRLWKVETVNRLNLVLTYLVLQAGTGIDHQLTKWSAKACEEHLGLGKPRAKAAIEELIRHRFIERTDKATMMSPQYRMLDLPEEEEPIFLPVALITGLGSETPILRRIRETGDPLVLRMLIDFYGMVQLDATHGVPIAKLRETPREQPFARKVIEAGVHAVWALKTSETQRASGDWTDPYRAKAKDKAAIWEPFWASVKTLKDIGAFWFDPWVFDGDALDAEPMFPVDPGTLYAASYNPDDVAELTNLAREAARALVAEEREFMLDRYAMDILVPLTQHRRAPALIGVVRLRIEADTPGRRLSYARRRQLIEGHLLGYGQVYRDAIEGRYDRPMRLTQTVDAE